MKTARTCAIFGLLVPTLLIASQGTSFARYATADTVQEEWVRHYVGSDSMVNWVNDIAVDNSGNVYVTGYSNGNYTDMATVKYNSAGLQQWDARYDLGEADRATAITVDDQGYVYVTGWGNDIFTLNAKDFVTIKYNSAGVEQWVSQYNGVLLNEKATDIAVDKQGNVYVTGTSTSFAILDDDAATVKYNAAGGQVWDARYEGPGATNDVPRGVAVDDSGNVYVLIYRYISEHDDGDMVTICYDINGTQKWIDVYNGPGNDDDQAEDIAVDDSGYVYVTGASYGSGTDRDFTTIKYNHYDSLATRKWVCRYDRDVDSDWPVALAVDGSGNVYVTGQTNPPDFMTIKINSAGVVQWSELWHHPDNCGEYAMDVALDQAGNIYVTGDADMSGANASDLGTIKYSPDGTKEWEILYYNGSEMWTTWASAMAVDNEGNVFVGATTSHGHEVKTTYTTIKYTQTPGTLVEEEITSQPRDFRLAQNYPNPFNPTTTIHYCVPEDNHVTLKIYNLLGQEIATLLSAEQTAGQYELVWNAGELASGVYFVRLQAGELVATRKVVLMK
ncbi:SBBP repeat-containing protein [bacterium]|nr:SBBP repeat-containing protein [bacterium]